ncbi:MAG: DUF1284 domain-containing protein [Lachnospiraceae bacterium]
MELIRLRPHHGLCIRHFEGKGYSEEFVIHMTEVIRRLQNGGRIKIVSSQDEICSCCLHRKETYCDSEERVCGFDQRVLEMTQTRPGEVLSYQDFQERIQRCIVDAGRFGEVCGDCGWGEICHGKLHHYSH